MPPTYYHYLTASRILKSKDLSAEVSVVRMQFFVCNDLSVNTHADLSCRIM